MNDVALLRSLTRSKYCLAWLLNKGVNMSPVRTKKQPIMTLPFPANLMGLCPDCVHSTSCALKTPLSVVFHCEEYDSLPINKKKMVQHPELPYPANLIGLCAHCDHAKTCVLRQPESVIFNCEHYQ